MGLTWANRMTILRILLIGPFVIGMLKINSPELDHAVRNLIRYVSIQHFSRLWQLVMVLTDTWLAQKSK